MSRPRLRLLALLVALALGGSLALAATRSKTAVTAFKRQSGFPKGRPGYVVDHILPLCSGAPDTPANMQWEPVAKSYVKDTYERQFCAALKRQGLILVAVPTTRPPGAVPR